jgi:hypothetical protein
MTDTPSFSEFDDADEGVVRGGARCAPVEIMQDLHAAFSGRARRQCPSSVVWLLASSNGAATALTMHARSSAESSCVNASILLRPLSGGIAACHASC